MSCVEIQPLLHAHADGELDLVNSGAVDRHLKACPACAAQMKSIHTLRAALQEPSLRHPAPASLRKAVQRLAPGPEETRFPRFQPARLWKWLALGMTTVAALLLVFRPGGDSAHDRFLNEAIASHVRSLMVQHLTDVASSDQHTVKPWFAGKLDFAPKVKDFAAEGFPLIGGRLDYLDGRTVAALVYQRHKHFINVFVWPAATLDGNKPAPESYRGYSIVSRNVGGLHYCLVSDLNEPELTELANLIKQ